MMHFLDDLEPNGPGGSDMPKRPKGDLASLIGNIKHSNKLWGVQLHKYLIKNLLFEDAVNQPGFAKYGLYTDLDQIRPHLLAGYERIRKQNAVVYECFWNTDVGLSRNMNYSDIRNGMGRTLTVEFGSNGWKLTSAFFRVLLKSWVK